MKRLLSVVAILVLAASLLPVKGQAGLRGSFDPITNSDGLIRGHFNPALRGAPFSGAGTPASPKVERWIAFNTLSSVVGSESVGEIWMIRNTSQACAAAGLCPVPLLQDPTAANSYIDPAWSRDGKWLAYVKTDNSVSSASIFVQQFDQSSSDPGIASTPLGSPILVADGTGGIHHRHPAWNSNGTQLAYDSDAFGPSIDLWTVGITLDAVGHTGTVGTPVRHQLGLDGSPTILNSKAEFKPSYSPDDTKLAFVTNRFGVFQISIVTLTADGTGETTVQSEINPALVTHDNPSWASDGLSIYYDAPTGENPSNPQSIWQLTLATGQKCPINVDVTGCVHPDVSRLVNHTVDGFAFNFFVFITQAAGFGPEVWRGAPVQDCKAPLPILASISPTNIDITKSITSGYFTVAISMAPSTNALGFVARSQNAGGDGIRMRRSIIPSPTMMGISMAPTPLDPTVDCTNEYTELTGDNSQPFVSCHDLVYYVLGSQNDGFWTVHPDTTGATIGDHIDVTWNSRTIQDRIIALNLVNRYVGLDVRAYSNRIGQQLLGFAYLRLLKKNTAASSIVLQQNAPNPFNPVTKIQFAVDKPGNVEVRVFNTRGELVRTVTNQWYPQGSHTVTWDGSTQSGGHAASGIYYIRARSGGGTDIVKAVLAK